MTRIRKSWAEMYGANTVYGCLKRKKRSLRRAMH